LNISATRTGVFSCLIYSNNIDSACKSWLHDSELRRSIGGFFARHAYAKIGAVIPEEMSKKGYAATGVHMIGAVGKTQYMMEELPFLVSQTDKWVELISDFGFCISDLTSRARDEFGRLSARYHQLDFLSFRAKSRNLSKHILNGTILPRVMKFPELSALYHQPLFDLNFASRAVIFSIGMAKKCSGAVSLASRLAAAAKTALIVRSPLHYSPASSAKNCFSVRVMTAAHGRAHKARRGFAWVQPGAACAMASEKFERVLKIVREVSQLGWRYALLSEKLVP